MTRIALANLDFPPSPQASVEAAVAAIGEAADAGAELICFPECFVPGYRAHGSGPQPATSEWLEAAHEVVRAAAAQHGIAVVLGTERIVAGRYRITAFVIGPDGAVQGWQDKVQLDPSEDELYAPGQGRHVFELPNGGLFGVVICHEGFRYPETVRAAVRSGASLVVHPHYSRHEAGTTVPDEFAAAGNSFHEAAARCRAAENECWFATINHAGEGSPTTSAFIAPDGEVWSFQQRGRAGLLIADLDLDRARRGLALRLRDVTAG